MSAQRRLSTYDYQYGHVRGHVCIKCAWGSQKRVPSHIFSELGMKGCYEHVFRPCCHNHTFPSGSLLLFISELIFRQHNDPLFVNAQNGRCPNEHGSIGAIISKFQKVIMSWKSLFK